MSNKKKRPTRTRNVDLPDSDADKKELKNEEATIDLPDVKDIPGQEYIRPPKLREFADTTISSADEEGQNVWNDTTIREDWSNVSDTEKNLLEQTADSMPNRDEDSLRRAELDNTDDDGEPLNEVTSANAQSGIDLDIPGADEDDADENIGEEDEENNAYSLGGDDNSINEERSGA